MDSTFSFVASGSILMLFMGINTVYYGRGVYFKSYRMGVSFIRLEFKYESEKKVSEIVDFSSPKNS